MNPSLGLIDLAPVLSMLGSFGSVTGLLSVLRTLFLDGWLCGLDAKQRDYALRIINYALNFLLILGGSLAMHEPFGWRLLLSVAVVTWGASTLSHATFHASVNAKQKAEPLYAEIPADDGASSSSPPEPPTDDPASLALLPTG